MTLETIIKKYEPLVTQFNARQAACDRLDFLLENRERFDVVVDWLDVGCFEIAAQVKLTPEEFDLIGFIEDFPEELTCELIEVEDVPDMFRKLGFTVYGN